MLTDARLDVGLRWLPDGRLLCVMHEEPPNQDSSNLFGSVFSSTGTFEGPPTRISSGEGTISQPSITSDGKRLAFDRVNSQSDVYVSEFSAKTAKTSTPRRLTIDDADDIPTTRVMRAPLIGEAPRAVVAAPGIANVMCSRAPASICGYIQELSTQTVFSTFDPMKGDAHEVIRLEAGTGVMNSGLSPDGKLLAVVKAGENRIRLLSISGQPAREIVPKNWSTFSSVDWAADSKGLFVTSNPTGWRSSLLYEHDFTEAPQTLKSVPASPRPISSRMGSRLSRAIFRGSNIVPFAD